jgi:hypothetical protein
MPDLPPPSPLDAAPGPAATIPAMSDLRIDLDALDDFGGRLSRMAKALDHARSLIESYESDYGHSGVRDAVHDFEDHWRDGRKHVHNTAESLSSMATESVKAVRKLDVDLEKKLRDAADGKGKK